MKTFLFSALLGLSLIVQAEANNRPPVEPLENLQPYLGTYALVETKYGECDPTIQIGFDGPGEGGDKQQMQPQEMSVLSVGPYTFPALNMGRQKFEEGDMKGWSKSSASFRSNGEVKLENSTERSWKTDSREEKSEVEVRLSPENAQVESTRKMRAPRRNHVHAHAKCIYQRGGGEGPLK